MSDSTQSTAQEHDDARVWREDEDRMRASYIATRRALAPYLVPHHFEKDDLKPEQLPRAKLGFGTGLNRSWLAEILGHVRDAQANYTWGALESEAASEDGQQTVEPAGGTALDLWKDATRRNDSWRNFFSEVLEWMLTSVGTLIVCDTVPGEAATQRDEAERGIRPYIRRVKVASLKDIKFGATGIEWLKIGETVDTRTHDGDGEVEARTLIYWLDEAGRTHVRREDDDGNPVMIETRDGTRVDEVDMGQFVDPQGQPTLPIVVGRFGNHPDIEWLGEGLIMQLADVVIDLFNLTTEMREGFRDEAFSVFAYKGDDVETVKTALHEGDRLVDIGASTDANLTRVGGDSSAVSNGMTLFDLAVRSWALSAKRKAEEAQERAQAPRSGVSLQAEFQLDLQPLLVEIATALDDVETRTMQILAQFADKNLGPDIVQEIGVTRNTDFDLEPEESRIARIVSEFSDAFGQQVPPTLWRMLGLKYVEASRIVDLAVDVEGEARTLRDQVDEELAAQAAATDQRQRQAAAFPF